MASLDAPLPAITYPDLPITERVATQVLSLPLHVGLTDAQIQTVANVLLDASSELSLELVAAALDGLE